MSASFSPQRDGSHFPARWPPLRAPGTVLPLRTREPQGISAALHAASFAGPKQPAHGPSVVGTTPGARGRLPRTQLTRARAPGWAAWHSRQTPSTGAGRTGARGPWSRGDGLHTPQGLISSRQVQRSFPATVPALGPWPPRVAPAQGPRSLSPCERHHVTYFTVVCRPDGWKGRACLDLWIWGRIFAPCSGHPGPGGSVGKCPGGLARRGAGYTETGQLVSSICVSNKGTRGCCALCSGSELGSLLPLRTRGARWGVLRSAGGQRPGGRRDPRPWLPL